MIGEVLPSPRAGHHICTIHDFLRFPEPLPFKVDGVYREPGATKNRSGSAVGGHFQRGVRRLDEASFAAIVRDAWRGSTPVAVADGAPLDTADGRFRQLVSDIAVELALAEARRRWPASTPDPLPVWRPGPGIRVARGVEAHAWIGIKGTPAPTPRFFVSEGERAFAEAHPEHYRLWVYVDIDAERRSGSLVEHRGPLAGPAVALTPSRWAGSLRT